MFFRNTNQSWKVITVNRDAPYHDISRPAVKLILIAMIKIYLGNLITLSSVEQVKKKDYRPKNSSTIPRTIPSYLRADRTSQAPHPSLNHPKSINTIGFGRELDTVLIM